MCKVTWCDTPIEEGLNGNIRYCSVHREYKKYGRNASSRPWLFYKTERVVKGNLKCESCGYDPILFYPDRPMNELSGLFDVDHINSDIKHTVEGEQPSNYQSICKNCHALKSYDNGDYTRKDFR